MLSRGSGVVYGSSRAPDDHTASGTGTGSACRSTLALNSFIFCVTACTAHHLPRCLHYPHAEAGDAVQLQQLLQGGADVNVSCYKARVTPLHLACRAGHLETVEVLLSAGADVEATTTGRIHWAASTGDPPLCVYYCRHYCVTHHILCTCIVGSWSGPLEELGNEKVDTVSEVAGYISVPLHMYVLAKQGPSAVLMDQG